MSKTWAEMEFRTLDLGDERLNKRAVKLIEIMGSANLKCNAFRRSISRPN